MASNSIGEILRITSFGESHGLAIGGIIDGFPPGIKIEIDFIQKELDRRKPGQSSIVTQRKETDKINILSGILSSSNSYLPFPSFLSALFDENFLSLSSESETTILPLFFLLTPFFPLCDLCVLCGKNPFLCSHLFSSPEAGTIWSWSKR